MARPTMYPRQPHTSRTSFPRSCPRDVPRKFPECEFDNGCLRKPVTLGDIRQDLQRLAGEPVRQLRFHRDQSWTARLYSVKSDRSIQ